MAGNGIQTPEPLLAPPAVYEPFEVFHFFSFSHFMLGQTKGDH